MNPTISFCKKINGFYAQTAPTAIRIFYYTHILFSLHLMHADQQAPTLTVIMVIDQLGYKALQKAKPFFKYGLKTLTTKGMVYHQTYMPHGLPTTAPGHTTLNTGTTPQNHGVVANSWIDTTGSKIDVDTDTDHTTLLLNDEGKSPQHIMVNGISDSFARTSTAQRPHYSFSISGKSRSAICTANKLGKAVWFDASLGKFTSSSFYFDTLPAWVNQFNQTTDLYHENNLIKWKSAFPLGHKAYQSVAKDGYLFTSIGSSFVGTTYHANHAIKKRTKKTNSDLNKQYSYLELTPTINKHIFDLSFDCIQQHVSKKKSDSLLLWLCISSLDKVGHLMGPDSYEVLDTLYHLDKQIGEFIKKIDRFFGLKKTILVLTADHGVAPIPELAHKQGLLKAERIKKKKLITELNNVIQQAHGISLACKDIMAANVYFDSQKIKDKRTEVLKTAKAYLQKQPFVHHVWTQYELVILPTTKDSVEDFFKRQVFATRSGDLILQVRPNCLIDEHKAGTSHETPYEDDTHIPLILYQKGNLEQRHITQKVFATQLAPTLGYLLQVPGPDVATQEVLPHIEPFENLN
jgi:predicted AlkP superfamily pyrophosphatase or phosphodiesterase